MIRRLVPMRAAWAISTALLLAMTTTGMRRPQLVSPHADAGTAAATPVAPRLSTFERADRACSRVAATLMRSAIATACALRVPGLGIARYVHEHRDETGSDALPVVIQGGLSANAWLYEPLRYLLQARGFTAFTSWEPRHGWATPAEDARHLAALVERVCEATGSPKVQIVGHSKGGLSSRYYIEQLGGIERVSQLVTLGSPIIGVRRRRRSTLVELLRKVHTLSAEREVHEDSRTVMRLQEHLPSFLADARRTHPRYRLTSVLVDNGRGSDGIVLREESLLPTALAPDMLANVVFTDAPATHCSIAALWRFNEPVIDHVVHLLAGRRRDGFTAGGDGATS